MKATVDRIEEGIAVLLVRPEERLRIHIPHELIPDAAEGDIVEITVCRQEREIGDAKERVSSLIEKLRQKGS